MGNRSSEDQYTVSLGDAIRLLDEICEQIANERSATGLSGVHSACERIAARIPQRIRDDFAARTGHRI